MRIIRCSLMLVSSFLLTGQVRGPVPGSQGKQTAQAGDAWRTSLSAFSDEVAKVASNSEIIDAPVAITRIREFVVFNGANGEKAWVVFKQGFNKELDAGLASRFLGAVSWRGEVESTRKDEENKRHLVFIRVPAPANNKKPLEFSEIALPIPFSTIPAESAPAKGTTFSFKGQMKKDATDPLGGNPVWVLYGVGSNSGKVEIHVSLKDVEPVK